MHGIKAKTYCTHETRTLSMTDHMTYENEHQAVRRLLEILKDRSWLQSVGESLAKLSAAKVYSEALEE